MTKERGPYIIVRDNDFHSYVIPKAREQEWEKWLALPSDDEKCWDVPSWAESVGGSQSLVEFNEYSIR